MDSFAQMTQDWSGFFSALAQVSGGLVGLVFVALTFNTRLLGANGDLMLGALARQTFGDFVLLLIISLMMLTPHTLATNMGAMFIGFCGLDAARIILNLVRLRRSVRGSGFQVVQRFVLSLVGHLLIGWTGLELLRGNEHPDLTGSLLFTGVVMLLLSGCRSAWLLVTHRIA